LAAIDILVHYEYKVLDDLGQYDDVDKFNRFNYSIFMELKRINLACHFSSKCFITENIKLESALILLLYGLLMQREDIVSLSKDVMLRYIEEENSFHAMPGDYSLHRYVCFKELGLLSSDEGFGMFSQFDEHMDEDALQEFVVKMIDWHVLACRNNTKHAPLFLPPTTVIPLDILYFLNRCETKVDTKLNLLLAEVKQCNYPDSNLLEKLDVAVFSLTSSTRGTVKKGSS